MSLGATTLSKTIFTIMTLSIMTLGIKGVLPVEHKHSAQKCNPIMLSVTLYFCHAECRYAECHYAECRYAKCRYAQCHYAECRYAQCHYAECLSAG